MNQFFQMDHQGVDIDMAYGQSLQFLFFALFGQRHYLLHVPFAGLSDQLTQEGVLVFD